MNSSLPTHLSVARITRILVLDRDPATHLFVRSGDPNVQYEVRQTSSFQETDTNVVVFRPDIVILASGWHAEEASDEPGNRCRDLMAMLRKTDRNLPVIVLVDGTGAASDRAIELLAQGATNCVAKPIFIPRLTAALAAAIEMRRQLRTPAISLEPNVHASVACAMLGKCESMLAAYRAIGIAAANGSAVLIRGESGTGKTMAAGMIHRHRRQPGKQRVIRCGELPNAVLEATLFDGTSPKFGEGTTWILEDINLAAIAIQRQVLDWIRADQASSSGSQSALPDAIVITSCESSSEPGVIPTSMCSELFYELRGGAVALPPLRDRGGDLELLVDHFVSQFLGTIPIEGSSNQRVAPEALKWLRGYSWPGNVTELRSIVLSCLKQGNGVLAANDFLYLLTRPSQQLASQHSSTFVPSRTVAITSSLAVPSLTPTEKVMVANVPLLQLRSPDYWAATVDAMIERAVKDGLDDQENVESGNVDASPHSSVSGASTHADTIEAVETGLINAVLRRTGGNLAQSARLLGLSRVSLRKKIHSLGLVIPGRGIST